MWCWFGCRHTQAHSAPPSPTLNLLDQTSPFSSSLWSTDSEFSNQPFPIFNEQSIPVPLFDFDQPQYPHRSLMPHYIQIFTQHLGMKCPFITYYDTLERFSRGILPPLLSSSIAALAARCVCMYIRVWRYLTFNLGSLIILHWFRKD